MPMASGFKCFNCGKGIMVGHNVSHAKNRLRRIFKPNLHSARITVDGRNMKVRLCTKCLRELKGRNIRSRKAAEKVSSVAPAQAGLV
jgi:large subunit ribosomal protein L28